MSKDLWKPDDNDGFQPSPPSKLGQEYALYAEYIKKKILGEIGVPLRIFHPDNTEELTRMDGDDMLDFKKEEGTCDDIN